MIQCTVVYVTVYDDHEKIFFGSWKYVQLFITHGKRTHTLCTPHHYSRSNAVIPAKSTLPLSLDFCRRLFLSCSSERVVWGTERLYSSGIAQQIQVDTQKTFIFIKITDRLCDHIASSYIKTEATSLLEGITVRITRWMKSLCYILARWQDKQAKNFLFVFRMF